MNKRAVIFGVSGQDGFYLTQLLKKKNYIVHGVSRRIADKSLYTGVDVFSSWDYKCFNSLMDLVDWNKVDEVYFLSGQSSVGYSFFCPSETYLSFILPLTMILDCIRTKNPLVKLYNACSSEVFGDTELSGADEKIEMKPVSPYGFAKKATSELIVMYRDIYNIFAVNGFLFNHESSRRPNTFLTKKIVLGAHAIKNKEKQNIELGSLDAIRDWGWAEDYVIPMHLMLQQDSPEDYIIASGEGHSLNEVATKIFEAFDLDFSKYYILNSDYIRKNDIAVSVGNPLKANKNLGWSSAFSFEDIIRKLTLR